ncbi:DUF397 domain-containing protein [Streptomyces toxytricini]|uniref:DUF397 domain-containing protein n=1 Tax=Streptomyces toxytricini TaxID=67369 RepID=A0ABW8E9D2_STRT5
MNVEQLAWFKSSHSSSGSGDCVEVAAGADAVHVRDSKVQDGPRIDLSPDTWAEFVGFAGSHS